MKKELSITEILSKPGVNCDNEYVFRCKDGACVIYIKIKEASAFIKIMSPRKEIGYDFTKNTLNEVFNMVADIVGDLKYDGEACIVGLTQHGEV